MVLVPLTIPICWAAVLLLGTFTHRTSVFGLLADVFSGCDRGPGLFLRTSGSIVGCFRVLALSSGGVLIVSRLSLGRDRCYPFIVKPFAECFPNRTLSFLLPGPV